MKPIAISNGEFFDFVKFLRPCFQVVDAPCLTIKRGNGKCPMFDGDMISYSLLFHVIPRGMF